MLPTPELEMQYMGWPDVRDRIAAGAKTAVFSVGAIEQHGPHLPIVVDALLGTVLARLVAAELGNALVAPVIRPGYSPHHMDFPGTITLRRSTLVAIIVDYCTSLAAHGFETIVVISSHGGNTTCVNYGVQEAQDVLGRRATVIPITAVTAYYPVKRAPHEQGYHATFRETSMILAVTPDLVHMERAHDWSNPIDPKVQEVGTLLNLRPTKFYAPDGTMGLPTGANAELGQQILSETARNIAKQIRAVQNQLREPTR